MTAYLDGEHPIRFAHRGSRVLWPENTMEAFQGAVDLGYRYIETDVRASADGVVHVFHDERLERLTNGAGPIARWRAAELAALDAAYHFDPARDHPRRHAGLRIPRLEAALAAFPEARFNIDAKSDDVVEPLARLILERGWEDRVLVAAFSDRRLRRFRRLTGGRIATSAGPRAAAAAWLAARAGRPAGGPAAALQLPQRHRGLAPVDAALVAAAHRGGRQVHVWTVNEPDEMVRLLDLGVDGIITDRPDVLNDVVAERNV